MKLRITHNSITTRRGTTYYPGGLVRTLVLSSSTWLWLANGLLVAALLSALTGYLAAAGGAVVAFILALVAALLAGPRSQDWRF